MALQLTSGQRAFVNRLSQDTGLNPALLSGWVYNEQNGSAAQNYQNRGYNNWLNVGNTDAVVASGGSNQQPAWSNPKTAADATAAWMEGKTTLGGYGYASQGIQNFVHNAERGAPLAQQISDLQHSGWASGGYPALPGLVNAFKNGGATGGSNPGIGGSYDPTAAVTFARRYLGTPYSYGGGSESGPTYGIDQGANTKGFDCSGLVQSALESAGVTGIARTSYAQWNQGQRVAADDLQPGDVVFWKSSDSKTGPNGQTLPGHEAIYIGNGQVIQAPQTGEKVQISNLSDLASLGYMGARRYTPNPAAGKAAATAATATAGSKAIPQPKSAKLGPLGGEPTLLGPNSLTSIIAGAVPPAFKDPFVFKPGVIPPTPTTPVSTPTPAQAPSFTPPTPAPAITPALVPRLTTTPPSFLNALSGK
jgi:cell wall-associated NlpC family hydrolase